MLTLDKIYHASNVLEEVARETGIISAPSLNKKNNVYLKTENLQVTGSFKVRGAYYKISQLSDEEKSKGIIACSAGNHAQGVALAAQKSNIPCLICMPDNAPISKVEATKQYGAKVELVSGAYDDAYNRALEIQQETGMTFIHPFDDEDVIAGQGTVGLEILEQLKNVDVVVVPIGGGGLISGVAYAIKTLKPSCKVIGVQAEEAASMYTSINKNKIIELESVNTFADGIAVKQPGPHTFDIISKYVDEIVTVSDDETAAAILRLMEKQKIVAEGAGAVSVAATMYNKFECENKNIVCVVSGGNIDVNILNRVITRGLLMSGRRHTLTIALVDKPGQLTDVSRIIAECGGNVISIDYDNADPNMAITSCFLRISLETRDEAQIKQIRTTLMNNGFKLVSERVKKYEANS